MSRLTQKSPDGTWHLRGVDLAALPPEVYGALCKLLAYEDTGLDPDEVERMKDDAEEIRIGSKIQGYEITGIYKDICIGHNPKAPDPYAVWNIEINRCGVWGGHYFGDRQEAEKCFKYLAF